MKKKLLSYALVASLAVTSVPTTALAGDADTSSSEVESSGVGAGEESGEDDDTGAEGGAGAEDVTGAESDKVGGTGAEGGAGAEDVTGAESDKVGDTGGEESSEDDDTGAEGNTEGGTGEATVPVASETTPPSTDSTSTDNADEITDFDGLKAAIEDGDVTDLKLAGNITLTGKLTISKELVIDGGGYTITGQKDNMDVFIELTNSADVTIKNATFTDFGNEAETVTGAGVIKINEGTEAVLIAEDLQFSKFNRAAIDARSGKITVKNCTIDCDNGATNRLTKGIVAYTDAEIEGGSITGSNSTYDGWSASGIETCAGATVAVNGVEINSMKGGISVARNYGKENGKAEVTLTDCEITAKDFAFRIYQGYEDMPAKTESSATLTVDGGTYTGDVRIGVGSGVEDDGENHIVINKGTFLNNPTNIGETKFIAGGKSCGSPEKNSYVVDDTPTISLDKENAVVAQGQTTALVSTITPKGSLFGDSRYLTWESEDAGIATVDNGTVTGVAKGETKIKVKSIVTGVQAKCTVIVTEGETSVIDETTVPVSNLEQTYTGSELEPTFGGTLKKSVDYEVSYADKDGSPLEGLPTNAGTYTVTIAAKDTKHYAGRFTVDFEIAKADQGQPAEQLTGAVSESGGGNSGQITGLSSDKVYQWKAKDAEWKDGKTTQKGATQITGLATGTYHVRYAEDANHNAGDYIEVGVGEAVEMYTLKVNGTVQGSYTEGREVQISTKEREGYTFTGWTATTSAEGSTVKIADKNALTTTITMPKGDVTVTAGYSIQTFTVSFHANGGTFGDSAQDEVVTAKIKYGEPAAAPKTPTKKGFKFKGWYTNQNTTDDSKYNNDPVKSTMALYAGWTQNGGSSSGGSSSGGSSGGSGGGGGKSSTTTPTTPATDNKSETTTTTNSDGSTTTTVTNPDGSSVETTTNPDGSKLVTETDENGAQAITETRTDGTEIRTEISRRGEVTSDITLPEGADEVTVKIPTENRPTAGTVAVIVNPDGTREIILYSSADRDGVTITLDRDARVEIIDNAKSFTDVSGSSWAKDSIDFVTARELFAGVSDTEFGHNSPMTRAMLMTVLARLDGQDTAGGATWYENGMNWAKAQGISDGMNPNGTITREQLAAMLYRYSGSPATSGNLDIFLDSGRVSGYATDALCWAVEQGVISGMGDGTLDPQGNATRAQVAAMLMRFMNAMS